MWKKKQLAERSLDRLQDAADAIADDLRSEVKNALKDAIDRASKAYDETRGKALGAAKSADGLLRDKALLMVGIAAGGALLTGMLLRGGHRAEPARDPHPTEA